MIVAHWPTLCCFNCAL